MSLLPQCLSAYPCGHGAVFTLPPGRFLPRNFRHPSRGRVVGSLAQAALPRRPPSLPSRALCLVKAKNLVAINQLQVTMAKYVSMSGTVLVG